jgi:phospholipid-transporting ATPase
LTGDKIETAINISYSCQLLNDEMLQIIVDGNKKSEVKESLENAVLKLSVNNNIMKVAVLVTGQALIKITKNKENQEQFIDICSSAQVVLACRMSPKQKADIVSMVKGRFP